MVACVCGSAVSVSLLFRKFSLLSLRGPFGSPRTFFFSSTGSQWRTLEGGKEALEIRKEIIHRDIEEILDGTHS